MESPTVETGTSSFPFLFFLDLGFKGSANSQTWLFTAHCHYLFYVVDKISFYICIHILQSLVGNKDLEILWSLRDQGFNFDFVPLNKHTEK
jgi:uncharacterized membrane protein YagU involved in acid resistance